MNTIVNKERSLKTLRRSIKKIRKKIRKTNNCEKLKRYGSKYIRLIHIYNRMILHTMSFDEILEDGIKNMDEGFARMAINNFQKHSTPKPTFPPGGIMGPVAVIGEVAPEPIVNIRPIPGCDQDRKPSGHEMLTGINEDGSLKANEGLKQDVLLDAKAHDARTMRNAYQY